MTEIELDLDLGGGTCSSFGVRRHGFQFWCYPLRWPWLSYLNSPSLSFIPCIIIIWIIIPLHTVVEREGKDKMSVTAFC